MSGWWVHDLYQAGRVTELVSWIFWVIAAIVLHELAHGWAAIWQGDRTPIEQHRMTANPLVHMGPYSLIAFALIGIAWGVMPVNPSRFRWGRMGRVFVSAAGPAMNIALSLLSLTLLIIWLKVGPVESELYRNLAVFLWTGGWLNVLLAIFNLIPVPPLDGSSILGGLSLRYYQLIHHPNASFVALGFLALVFFTPLGDWVFGAAQISAYLFTDGIGSLVGNPSIMDVV